MQVGCEGLGPRPITIMLYRLFVRPEIEYTLLAAFAAKVLESDGVKLAVNVLAPRTDGFQLQVAV